MVATTTEVLVIGSGVNGGFTAYHAARQGRKVLVLERAEVGVEPAASWASFGGVRRQGRDIAEIPLAIEAIERWRTLEDELEADLQYRRDGQIKLAEREADVAEIDAFVREQNAHGLDDVRLVDRAEIAAMVPGISDRVLVGSYAPRDGHAHPPSTTKAAARAAQRHGAAYRNGARATALLRAGDRIVGVRTADGEEIHAEETVLAAGIWSDEIAATVDLRLPIRLRSIQIMLTTPAPPGTLKPVIGAIGRAANLKQLPGGEFYLGGGWPGQPRPDRRSYDLLPESEEGNWAAATGLLPAIGRQRIARKWCGLEAMSIDGLPFIGRVPGIEGLTLALGFSGHGFAISPAVGRAVADLIAGKPTPQLDALSPARIATFAPDDIASFLAAQPLEQVHAG